VAFYGLKIDVVNGIFDGNGEELTGKFSFYRPF